MKEQAEKPTTTAVKKSPLFGTDIDVDPNTGKQFELLSSGLFIPLPGEFKAEPPPPETAPIAVAEKGLFVPRSQQRITKWSWTSGWLFSVSAAAFRTSVRCTRRFSSRLLDVAQSCVQESGDDSWSQKKHCKQFSRALSTLVLSSAGLQPLLCSSASR